MSEVTALQNAHELHDDGQRQRGAIALQALQFALLQFAALQALQACNDTTSRDAAWQRW
jgi:hypothetical protein